MVYLSNLHCILLSFPLFYFFFCQKVLLTIGELSLLEIKIHQNVEKNGERGEARTEPLVAVPNHVVSIIQMLLSPTLSNENNENPSEEIEDIEGNKEKKEDDTQNEKQNEKLISSSTFSSSASSSSLPISDLDSTTTTAGTTNIPTPIRAHAFVAVGKLCLNSRLLTKEFVPLFARELQNQQTPISIRNNILIVLVSKIQKAKERASRMEHCSYRYSVLFDLIPLLMSSIES